MAYEPESPTLFNPFLLWADMGMRATEMAVASTQNITEGADRVTRAVASAEADEIVDAADAQAALPASAWPAASWDGIASMQRLAWDLMAQSWVRWLSTAGNLMSASAGDGLARSGAGVMGVAEHAVASDEAKPRRKQPRARARKTAK